MSGKERAYQRLSDDEVKRIRARLEPFLSERRRRRIEEVLAARTRQVVLILEDIYSDHNSAAVFRTADAMGLVEVHHVSASTPLRVSKKVALGSEKWMETVRHSDISSAYAALRGRGYAIWAAAVHGVSTPSTELPDEPMALVFGNEHAGLSESGMASADGRFHLRMHGFAESYNVSVAAALTLESVVAARRRRGALRGLSPFDADRLRVAWYARSVRSAPQLLEQEDLPFPTLGGADFVLTDDSK